MLKDDADWKALGIKDGHTFMLMGSAESDIVKEPVERPVFVEVKIFKSDFKLQ